MPRCEIPTPRAIRKSNRSCCVIPWKHEGWHKDQHGVRWLTFHTKDPKARAKYGSLKKTPKEEGVSEATVSKVWNVLEGRGDG